MLNNVAIVIAQQCCKCWMKDQRRSVAYNCYKQQCCLVYVGLNQTAIVTCISILITISKESDTVSYDSYHDIAIGNTIFWV